TDAGRGSRARTSTGCGKDGASGLWTWCSSGSITHDGLAPLVQGSFLMRPDAGRSFIRADLDLGGHFRQIAVRIADHEEDVVPRAVPADAPDDGFPHPGHVIAPVFHLVPALGLEGEMVETRHGRTEQGQGM